MWFSENKHKILCKSGELLCCKVFKFLLRKDLLYNVCCYLQIIGILRACMHLISAYQ